MSSSISSSKKLTAASESSNTAESSSGKKFLPVTVRRGPLGCRRMYAGHFQGSAAPRFQNGQLQSVRGESIMQELDKLKSREGVRKRRMEEMVKRVKFDRALQQKSHDFEFEMPTERSADDGSKKMETKKFLGKTVSSNSEAMVDVIFELDIANGQGSVFPVSMVEFQVDSLLKSAMTDEEENALMRAKRQRKTLKRDTDFEAMNSLFGMDEDTLTKKAKYKKKKEDGDEKQKFIEFMAAKTGKKAAAVEAGLIDSGVQATIDRLHKVSDAETSMFDMDMQITRNADSKRLKSNRTHGAMEEASEFAEIAGYFSNDEEELQTHGDGFRPDEGEEFDELADDSEGGLHDDSEDAEEFKLMQSELSGEKDILQRDYVIPVDSLKPKEGVAVGDGGAKKKAADGVYRAVDIEEDDDNDWMQISDEDESEEEAAAVAKAAATDASAKAASKRSRSEMGATDKGVTEDVSNAKKARVVLPPFDRQKLATEVLKVLDGSSEGVEANDLWAKVQPKFPRVDRQTFRTHLGAVLKTLVIRKGNKLVKK